MQGPRYHHGAPRQRATDPGPSLAPRPAARCLRSAGRRGVVMGDDEGGQAADHDEQWRHDWERHGRLRAGPNEWLAPLAALVELYAVGPTGLPVSEAARRVVAALQDHACVPLFVTRPGRWAASILEEGPVLRKEKPGRGGKPGTPALAGRAALVNLLSAAWAGVTSVAQVHAFEVVTYVPATRVAVLVDDAAKLFPDLFTAVTGAETAAPAGQPGRQVIQPEGGAWPHADGASWTAAERDALFEMRHRLKWPGPALLQIMTPPGRKAYTRKLLHDLIGPQGLQHDSFDGTPWEPSDELLKRCGLQRPASPMPRLAATTTPARPGVSRTG